MTSDLYAVSFSDLNTLVRVYENRSFTKTATELGVNQSAISYTIDKLRKHFGDPLFVRMGGGITTTARCAEIVTSARELLTTFETIALPRAIDPATTSETLAVACNFFERQLILPSVVRYIRKHAPGLHLEIIPSTSQGDVQLKHGSAAFLIGPLVPVETGFFTRKLLDEHYVCVMDRDNPLARGPLGKQDYLTCNHALVTYGGSWKSPFRTALENLGLKLNNVLSVPSPAALTALLEGTDLVSTVPSRLAHQLGDQLVTVPCPFPAPFEIHLVWTERTHKSALHVWFRNLIFESAKA